MSSALFKDELKQSDYLYLTLTVTFSVFLVLSNAISCKIFRIPFTYDLALPIGVITYPGTFLITDIVSEVWGPKRANTLVHLGFFMSLLMVVIVQIAVALPPSELWISSSIENSFQYQEAYEAVFSTSIVAFIASMTAYVFAQLIDIRIFHFIKYKTRGKHLWLRNNLSTLCSQIIDTVIVSSIFLYWGLQLDFITGLEIMLSSYSYKAIFALIDTPFCYLGVSLIRNRLKKSESYAHAYA